MKIHNSYDLNKKDNIGQCICIEYLSKWSYYNCAPQNTALHSDVLWWQMGKLLHTQAQRWHRLHWWNDALLSSNFQSPMTIFFMASHISAFLLSIFWWLWQPHRSKTALYCTSSPNLDPWSAASRGKIFSYNRFVIFIQL